MSARGKAGRSLVGFLVLATGVVLVGALQKAPCADRQYVELREGVTFQCYSDVADLLHTEQLLGDRLPYIDPCTAAERPCDEYPVGSMYVMRGMAWLSHGEGDLYARFYWWNVALLLICALATTWALERLGAQTLLFAVAPTLAIYGTMNWDLIPVALSTGATLALLRGRGRTSGLLLGIAGAVKIYPLLLVPPFALHLRARGDRRGALRLVAWAAVVWLAANLPLAVWGTDGWLTFFRFNAARPAEYDSLWRVACEAGLCLEASAVNVLSLLATAVLTAVVWRARVRRWPTTPLWHLCFPLLVAFLLTNKVASPQYGLWLLPWFALVAPSMRPFLAYQATEVLVYMARFSVFPSPDADPGIAYGWLAAALLLRAAALTWVLVEWLRSPVAEQTEFLPEPHVATA